MRLKSPAFLLVLLLSASACLDADEIILKNGDRLQAEKLEEKTDSVKFHHPDLGDMEISKVKIESISKKTPAEKERKKGDISLDRRVAAGYEAARGNTDRDYLHGDFLFNRNRLWLDEWTLKGEGAQEYSKDKKITQKGNASVRYARSITQQAYHFYRLGGEHDRFEGVDARVTPTAGLGYWIWDRENLKLMGEGGAGYEYEFLRGAKDRGAPILHLREGFSKKMGSIEIGEDIFYFPHVTDFGDYRIEGEAYLRFILTRHLAFKFKAGDQYRSRPVNDKKKNDFTLTSSVEWLF